MEKKKVLIIGYNRTVANRYAKQKKMAPDEYSYAATAEDLDGSGQIILVDGWQRSPMWYDSAAERKIAWIKQRRPELITEDRIA